MSERARDLATLREMALAELAHAKQRRRDAHNYLTGRGLFGVCGPSRPYDAWRVLEDAAEANERGRTLLRAIVALRGT